MTFEIFKWVLEFLIENFEIAMMIKGRKIDSSSEIFQDLMSLSRKKFKFFTIPVLKST